MRGTGGDGRGSYGAGADGARRDDGDGSTAVGDELHIGRFGQGPPRGVAGVVAVAAIRSKRIVDVADRVLVWVDEREEDLGRASDGETISAPRRRDAVSKVFVVYRKKKKMSV